MGMRAAKLRQSNGYLDKADDTHRFDDRGSIYKTETTGPLLPCCSAGRRPHYDCHCRIAVPCLVF
eukprot:COSAG01_NODE_249_length_20357_cov_3.458171_4_plen_65_part_00